MIILFEPPLNVEDAEKFLIKFPIFSVINEMAKEYISKIMIYYNKHRFIDRHDIRVFLNNDDSFLMQVHCDKISDYVYVKHGYVNHEIHFSNPNFIDDFLKFLHQMKGLKYETSKCSSGE